MTTSSANKLLSEWKTRLGLDDWEIALHVDCEPHEMSIDDAVGCSIWTEASKCAVIQILAERYYGDRVRPYDFEKTLVHELLHLKTTMIGTECDELQARLVHQLVDEIARAMVDLKRSGKDDKDAVN